MKLEDGTVHWMTPSDDLVSEWSDTPIIWKDMTPVEKGALLLAKHEGLPVALQVHDEVVCVVPEGQADACKDFMMGVMSTPAKWAPDLPVACEADVGVNYGDAK